MIDELLPQAERIAARLKARGETISVAESSTAGLISAALLAIAGASAYFMGGAVVYTRQSRSRTARSHRAGIDRHHPLDRGLCLALRRARSAASSRQPGRSARPEPPGRPAAATAMPPVIPASPSSAPMASARSPSRPATATGSTTCAPSPSPLSTCWRSARLTRRTASARS